MGNRVAMVSIDGPHLPKQNQKSLLGSDQDKETIIYEAGMIEVLTELARMHYLKFDVERVESPAYLKASNDAEAMLAELEKTLTKTQSDMLDEFSDLATYQQHFELEDVFVKGFIHGYRFLKQLSESRRD